MSPIKNLESLNQPISIASKAFSTLDLDAAKKSSEKLNSLLLYSKMLKSKNLIPFASFVYFCSEDNNIVSDNYKIRCLAYNLQ